MRGHRAPLYRCEHLTRSMRSKPEVGVPYHSPEPALCVAGPVVRLDGSGGAMAGSGLAAPAPILAAMLALSDKLRATRFPIGLAFLGRGRAERAITEQQVFGRQALAASVPEGEVVD